MAPHGRQASKTVIGASLIGVLTTVVGTLASVWVATGTTPLWVDARWPRLPGIASRQYVNNVPIDFIAMTWFVVIGLSWARRRAGGGVLPFWTIVSAACVVGLEGLAAWDTHFACIPPLLAGGAGVIVILAAAGHETSSVKNLTQDTLRELHAICRNAVARACVVCLPLGAFLGGQTLHAMLNNATPAEARERFFARWYPAQPVAPGELVRSPSAIKIVMFTDYQCPGCASAMLDAESMIANYNNTAGRKIEMAVLDFPLNPKCNVAVTRTVHSAACDAAVAVRLVHQHLGEKARHDMTTWLYQHNSLISTEMILKRLEVLQLEVAFKNEYATLVQGVGADAQRGAQMGVAATPTFFMDGVKLRPGSAEFQIALSYAKRPEGKGVVR